ncbi:DUF983 domain-containing protein [Sphingomonas rhizophila]|jgi:uncharacterized protein (DUF983 family)|uniref:DUF983 domain-containing protein n=1 Tax=Sphingomonas rhizophila TaxID=2071607 RepID=A0A7G9SB07_9SPHN|nr:DUF983 domain-containing protein [Sphingomonas rhizophila]QNN65032.1 DUF983 domain-containing protein [Sphingomonas rhizophila]
MNGAPPSLPAASLLGLCPQCGERTLFAGIARFAPRCRTCGLDFAAFNVGDGPALFLILIIGTLLTVGALVVDAAYSPSYWVHLVWLPIGIGLTLAGLRIGKAALLFQEYRHRAREGRIVP